MASLDNMKKRLQDTLKLSLPSGEHRIQCPNPTHADTNPSAYVNLDKGVYYCHVCHEGGSAAKLLFLLTEDPAWLQHPELPIKQSVYLDFHQTLLDNEKLLSTLQDDVGISRATVRARQIGYDPETKRFSFPIFDMDGECINIRKYQPGAENKVINCSGLPKEQLYSLYPYDIMLSYDNIYLVEGEKDALRGLQEGLPCVTTTMGAGGWSESFNLSFKNKRVSIVYDIDEAGIKGAHKIADILRKITPEVSVLKLPLNTDTHPKGDLSDFFDAGYSTADLQVLTPAEDIVDDKDNLDGYLAQMVPSILGSRKGRTRATLMAKREAPLIAPTKVVASCSRNMKDNVCGKCPAIITKEFTLDPTSQGALDILLSNRTTTRLKLVRLLGIPTTRCDVQFEETEHREVEWCVMQSPFTLGAIDEHACRRDILNMTGKPLFPNITYDVDISVRQDMARNLILLGEEFTPRTDSLEEFRETLTKDHDLLYGLSETFKPAEDTVESIDAKLDDIYKYLSYITGIHGRKREHLAVDLAYHSVLLLPSLVDGSDLKGWIEVLLIGDTGTGKTSIIEGLMKHYGLGGQIDMGGATVAGLVGGLVKRDSGYIYTWGAYPQYDRRLLALDEISDADQDLLGSLTSMRSSGLAQITKVEKFTALARTRTIWTSNPRLNLMIHQYSNGVQLINELIGSPADVRRFDFALLATERDVTPEMMRKFNEEPHDEDNPYTHRLCNAAVLWAWTRTSKEVLIPPMLRKYIFKEAEEMGKKYHNSFPLVVAGDMPNKLLRLATSLACRLFSTDDGVTIQVKQCHVDYIVKYLADIYDEPVFGYKEYSRRRFAEMHLSTDEIREVEDIIKGMSYPAFFVDELMARAVINRDDLADMMGVTGARSEELTQLITTFLRCRALKRIPHKRNLYAKTDAFTGFLQRLEC